MAVRPIDGDELLDITRLLETDEVRQSRTASWLLDQVLHDIQGRSPRGERGLKSRWRIPSSHLIFVAPLAGSVD